MRNIFVIVLALSLVAVGASTVAAQTPYLMLFFDDLYTDGNMELPPAMGTPDSAYVVAHQFNQWFSAIEYMVNYPTQMAFVGDDVGESLAMGNTSTGISQAWAIPRNGYSPVMVAKVKFLWTANGCSVTDIPILIGPHPVSTQLRAVKWPENTFFSVVGMTSLICGTTPNQPTTWGNIKALYNE